MYPTNGLKSHTLQVLSFFPNILSQIFLVTHCLGIKRYRHHVLMAGIMTCALSHETLKEKIHAERILHLITEDTLMEKSLRL